MVDTPLRRKVILDTDCPRKLPRAIGSSGSNSTQGFPEKQEELGPFLVVMEATGGYERSQLRCRVKKRVPSHTGVL